MASQHERIAEMLTEDRIKKFTARLSVGPEDHLVYDLSKTHLRDADVKTYRERLVAAGLAERMEKMRNGDPVNYTENRPVLHCLLRDTDILNKVEAYMDSFSEFKRRSPLNSQTELNMVDLGQENKKFRGGVAECQIDHTSKDDHQLKSIKIDIFNELIKIHDFSQEFKSLRGVTGKAIDTVVSIGIGGSDLGPKMVSESLQFYSEGAKVRFISNIDSTNTLQVFSEIDVEKTLFIVVSKTFTTAETIENFRLAKLLFEERVEGEERRRQICNTHFVAVSSNTAEVERHGIKRVFKMWDFVGGRYSMWSAAGLSIVLSVGFGNYVRMLRGAAAADADFFANGLDSVSARLSINELYYSDRGYNNKCVVCYDSYLGLLYKYLQQAEMESNGKRGSKQMIIWGGTGTDVQHSFFQLLHQGEQNILTEFLLPMKNLHVLRGGAGDGGGIKGYGLGEESLRAVGHHHSLLVANCLAQSRSLMVGRESDDPSKEIRGNKPSVTVLYTKLSPEVLGAIIAVYEHKIFVEGVFYGINSFDQFGVQLGKDIALDLHEKMREEHCRIDSSTDFLIRNIRE